MHLSFATPSAVVANFRLSFRTLDSYFLRPFHPGLAWKTLRLVSMANEPLSKRMKKEIAETNHNNSTEQTTLAKFTEKRKNVCKSVAEFKFNKKRVRLISSNTDMPDSCKGIAYWMWRDQRVQGKLRLLVCGNVLDFVTSHWTVASTQTS